MRATVRIPTKILREHELEPSQRITLITLFALCETEQLIAWVGSKDLATALGFSWRRAQEHLKRLETGGYIKRVTRPDGRSKAIFRGFAMLVGIDGVRRNVDSQGVEA